MRKRQRGKGEWNHSMDGQMSKLSGFQPCAALCGTSLSKNLKRSIMEQNLQHWWLLMKLWANGVSGEHG